MLEILKDYTFQIVALGACMLGIFSGGLGCYTMLRKESLLGDGIAHSALPGVVLSFLIVGSKDLEILLLGALCTGVLSALLIKIIVAYTKIKMDSALAMTLSVFFGLGMVLLTISQKIPNANQAGLDKFIYGQASTMLMRDVKIIVGCGILFILIIILCWKEFKLIIFDKEFAYTLGYPIWKIESLLTMMIIVTIIIGLQSVGVILMSAMLVAPAIGARQWSHNLGQLMILSGIMGGITSILGVYTSAYYSGIPTGPTIVMYSTFFAMVSILIAPGRGILWKYKIRKEST